MSLTFGGGPLAVTSDADSNYSVVAPARRMLFQPYPRRMRAVVSDRVLLDSLRAHLLHATDALPQLYFPHEDFDGELLERSDTVTECRLRGPVGYWSVHLNGITLPDAVWSYERPPAGWEWLRGQTCGRLRRARHVAVRGRAAVRPPARPLPPGRRVRELA
jgi:uncharacterized protein (DUF427 family)